MGGFVANLLEKGPLGNVRCRVCLLPLLDETANRHRESCKENLSLSLLPATSAAYPCSPGSAQAVLVPPLFPRSVQSVYVHCRTGEAKVLPSPGQLQGQVCTFWDLALAQAILPTIQKSLQGTGFGQRSVVLQWSFCDQAWL